MQLAPLPGLAPSAARAELYTVVLAFVEGQPCHLMVDNRAALQCLHGAAAAEIDYRRWPRQLERN
eukprot:5052508-Alexandrium_andersonii.AAC.1